MALAGFMDYRDDLMCDLAQYYGIYDMEALPVKTLAGLSCGLPSESRIMMRISGAKIPIRTALLAGIMDRLSLLIWMQTKDAKHRRNKPKSVLSELIREKPKERISCFKSAEDFEAARRRIIEEGDKKDGI